MSAGDRTPILSVRDLTVHFFTKQGIGKAVDGVSFDLYRGETMGLVGESGCGKSMTILSIIGLHPKPTARVLGGQALFRGKDLLQMAPPELRQYRGKHIALVLQDPMTALNPVFTIGNQLIEALRLHQTLGRGGLRQRAIELLQMLRIPTPEERLDSYPHRFSGGMRQRIVGAIALAGSPEVLIADEPTTSLDATIEAAYLALLKEIQERTGLAIVYISHDLNVVARMCDRVSVMYAGKVVESAPTEALFARPAHPYTKMLLKAVPDVRSRPQRLTSVEGQPPSIYELPAGCPFVDRCPEVRPMCSRQFPAKMDVGPSHSTSCWRYL
jgi:peptide/nickel transport system ATP-binding protein/oligopeptide transport system ATP-binding protein